MSEEAVFEVMDISAAPASYFEEEGYGVVELRSTEEERTYENSGNDDLSVISYSQKLKEYKITNDKEEVLYLYEFNGDWPAENFIRAKQEESIEDVLEGAFDVHEEYDLLQHDFYRVI